MSNRIEKANSELQRCLSNIIHNKMNDPRINDFVSIASVNVTPDFKFCKIKISLIERDFPKAKEIVATLQKSEGYIKNELKKLVKMPQVPKLTFEFDKSIMNVIRIDEILKNLDIPKEESEDGDDNR